MSFKRINYKFYIADCGKLTENGEHIIGNGIPATQNIILDKNSDQNVLPITPKPRVKKSIKPFLTFHRIRINVNRGGTDNRKLGRKDRRRHNLRNSHSTRKTFNDKTESIPASNVKRTTTAPSQSGEKFYQSQAKVGKNRQVETSLDSQKENTVSHKEKTTETVRQGKHERKPDRVSEQESKPKDNVKHVDKNERKDPDIPSLNVKQTVINKMQENVVFREKTVQLSTISSKENRSSTNVKNKDKKTDLVVGKSKDMKDSLYLAGVTSNVTDEKIYVNGNVVNVREEKNSKDKVVESPKNKKNLVVEPKDEKSSTDLSLMKSNDEITTDHTLLEPKDDKGSVDHIIPIKAGDRWSRKGLSQVPDVERLVR